MRATCGVPVTVAASWKSTVTEIRSPAVKTPLAPIPLPESLTPVTVGPTPSEAPPFTAKPAAFATAWVPRPGEAALFPPSTIVPLFRSSAEAPMPIPSLSRSATRTV